LERHWHREGWINLMRETMKTRRLWSVLVLAGLFGAHLTMAQPQEIPLGTAMPMLDRAMTDAAGATVRLQDLKGPQATVVVFWSNRSPWVEKAEERLLTLARAYRNRGVSFVLVNPNDPVADPQEGREESQRRAQRYGVRYLMDAGSDLAEAFGASRTPQVFVFNADNALVYSGTLDDSPGDPASVQKHYLRDALDALLSGTSIAVPRTKAFGSMIKFQQ
jgi:hypothetical protein